MPMQILHQMAHLAQIRPLFEEKLYFNEGKF